MRGIPLAQNGQGVHSLSMQQDTQVPPAEMAPPPDLEAEMPISGPAAPPPGPTSRMPKKRGRKKKVKTPEEKEALAERRRERDRVRKRAKADEKRREAPPVGPSPRFRAPPPPAEPATATNEPTVETSEEVPPPFGADGINVGAMLDPVALASVGVAMLDTGVCMLAGKVLGEDALQLSAMDTPKQKLLEDAAAAYLATLNVEMSPAQVLISTVVLVYLPPALMVYGAQKMGGVE